MTSYGKWRRNVSINVTVCHALCTSQFCRLVEKASKGDHLFDNHTTECAPPPLRNHLVKPMSEKILKVSTLSEGQVLGKSTFLDGLLYYFER